MKKYLLLLTVPAVLFYTGCKNSKTGEEEPTAGLKEIKFGNLGDTLIIMVPDTLSGNMEIKEQAWGATEIKIGDKFELSIEQNDGDTASTVSDIQGDDVFKLQRFIKREPDLLFWEAKNPDMNPSRFHFYSIQKVGKNNYVVRDVENDMAYSENNVQVMIDAAKRLKGKAPATEEPKP